MAVAIQQLTVGVLAKLLGQPAHRITYLLESRGIRPTSRAGNSYVYDDSVLDRLRAEIQRVDAAKAAAQLPTGNTAA